MTGNEKTEKEIRMLLRNASIQAAACVAFLFFALDSSMYHEVRHDPQTVRNIITNIGFPLISCLSAAGAVSSFGKAIRAEIRKLGKPGG